MSVLANSALRNNAELLLNSLKGLDLELLELLLLEENLGKLDRPLRDRLASADLTGLLLLLDDLKARLPLLAAARTPLHSL